MICMVSVLSLALQMHGPGADLGFCKGRGGAIVSLLSCFLSINPLLAAVSFFFSLTFLFSFSSFFSSPLYSLFSSFLSSLRSFFLFFSLRLFYFALFHLSLRLSPPFFCSLSLNFLLLSFFFSFITLLSFNCDMTVVT